MRERELDDIEYRAYWLAPIARPSCPKLCEPFRVRQFEDLRSFYLSDSAELQYSQRGDAGADHAAEAYRQSVRDVVECESQVGFGDHFMHGESLVLPRRGLRPACCRCLE